MSKLWYNNPKILFDDMHEFFPNNNLTREQKINAIARFSLYYSVLVIVFQQDTKWLSISVLLIIVSYSLGYYENFEDIKKNDYCTQPTKNNPFMNFTIADLTDNPNRPAACPYDNVKESIKEEFSKSVLPDPADLWGKNISQRNFFTMPWTTATNDQTALAKWLYGNSGECKNLGKNCDKNRDNRYHQSRYYINY
jgi:hypothetical protein